MAKVKPQFECRWCHRMCRRKDLEADHGRFAPKCMAYRSYDWLIEHDYSYPGRDEAVLRLAGLIKHQPVQAWITEYLDRSKLKPGEPYWIQHEMVEFVPTAPKWAIKMARQLVEDQAMIQRLKIGNRQKRVGTQGARKRQAEGLSPDYVMMIPIEKRAQIIRAAATNPLVNTMITDEQGGLETAIIIARDMNKNSYGLGYE